MMTGQLPLSFQKHDKKKIMKGNLFHFEAAEMLELASEQFSHHGCNDLDDKQVERIRNWSDTQKRYFIHMADKWNRGSTELTPDNLYSMPDWMLMDVLAYILKNEPE